MTNFLKTSLQVGALALALGGTALATAVPAQAAGPDFGFNLQFGNGGFGYHPGGGVTLHFGDKDFFKYCKSDTQIIRELRRQGYSMARQVRQDRRSTREYFVAFRHGDWYQLRVDACTGKVDDVRKLRRRHHNNNDNDFEFHFGF